MNYKSNVHDLPRLKIHSNHRFLTTENGDPFFWLGDTAWWIRRLAPEEVEQYLSHRSRHGFNLIQVHCGFKVADYAGNKAFHDDDPLKPGESYWHTIDEIVERARSHRLYVALAPMWGDEYGKAFGEDLTRVEAFGYWIGNRYAHHSHILWIVSGEYDSINGFRLPVSDQHLHLFEAVAKGLRRAHEGCQLMTIHPGVARSSSLDFHQADWLDFNMLQSGHMNDCHQFELPENHELIASDYTLTPVKPVLDGEPFYEDTPDGVWSYKSIHHPRGDDAAMRRKAYWSVFAGAFGHTYGHNDVYGFFTPSHPGFVQDMPQGPGNRGDWRLSLDAPGALQMKHLRAIIESRSFFDRVPDDSLVIGDLGDGLNRVKGTCSAGYEWAMFYLPFGQPVQIDLSRLAGGPLKMCWFDPRTGVSHSIENGLSRQVNILKPPVLGTDWVLIVESNN